MANLLNNYGENPTQAFYDSLSVLRVAALNLPSNAEKITVGVPIAVANSSSQFWAMNGTTYANQLWVNMKDVIQPSLIVSPMNPQPPKNYKLNLRHLVKADVHGAVEGVIDGALVGGVGGALAGGVLDAATHSLYDIADQLIGQWTGWW